MSLPREKHDFCSWLRLYDYRLCGFLTTGSYQQKQQGVTILFHICYLFQAAKVQKIRESTKTFADYYYI